MWRARCRSSPRTGGHLTLWTVGPYGPDLRLRSCGNAMTTEHSAKSHIIPPSEFKSGTQGYDTVRRTGGTRRELTGAIIHLAEPVKTVGLTANRRACAARAAAILVLPGRWRSRESALAHAQPIAGVQAALGGLAMRRVLGVTIEHQSGGLTHAISLAGRHSLCDTTRSSPSCG